MCWFIKYLLKVGKHCQLVLWRREYLLVREVPLESVQEVSHHLYQGYPCVAFLLVAVSKGIPGWEWYPPRLGGFQFEGEGSAPIRGSLRRNVIADYRWCHNVAPEDSPDILGMDAVAEPVPT